MLASCPASMLNQISTAQGIPSILPKSSCLATHPGPVHFGLVETEVVEELVFDCDSPGIEKSRAFFEYCSIWMVLWLPSKLSRRCFIF
jgi:hypothetical protein